MLHFDSPTVATLFYVLAGLVGVVLLWLGYRSGRWTGRRATARQIAAKEQELFTAQRGFRSVYEQELNQLKQQNAALEERTRAMETRVEEYRKKAAGLGGLFSSGGRRADAMYALLLENEALEEALYSQNEKLRQERTDAVKEQLRSNSYRRVLISHLLNDRRIKEYVSEVLCDDQRLPAPNGR